MDYITDKSPDLDGFDIEMSQRPVWACEGHRTDFFNTVPHFWWECERCLKNRDEMIYAEENLKRVIRQESSDTAQPTTEKT